MKDDIATQELRLCYLATKKILEKYCPDIDHSEFLQDYWDKLKKEAAREGAGEPDAGEKEPPGPVLSR